MALSAVGVAATIGVFGASNRTTLAAQQGQVGAQQAQAEIDRLSKLRYGQLALTSTPTNSTDPLNPNNRVSGGNFNVRAGLTEALVTTAGEGETAQVDPGPDNFDVGSGGSTITGKIYRYVSWRDENCPATICDGTENTKRVTVAVTVDPQGNNVQRVPVWFSTVISDPSAAPEGYTGNRRRHGRRRQQHERADLLPVRHPVRADDASDSERQSLHPQHRADKPVLLQLLHLREQRSDEAAGPDVDRAAGRQRPARVRVLRRPRRRLPRRPGHDAQGQQLRHELLGGQRIEHRGAEQVVGARMGDERVRRRLPSQRARHRVASSRRRSAACPAAGSCARR